jgi:hypothetical protein
MQDQQVDLVDSQLAGALAEAAQRLVIAVVADPNLGLQEHLRAIQPRTAHRFPNLPLVAVGSRCVNVPVAGRDRRCDRGPRLISGCLEHSQTQPGQLDTVVQHHR